MAGYNNYFPQTYANGLAAYGASPTYLQNLTQPVGTQTQLGAINWVQGEAGARSVPVGAGQKALLMDSETNVFYVKSCDASGMPLPLRTFEYKEITDTSMSMAPSDAGAPSTYVTHAELDKILNELKIKTEPTQEVKEIKSKEEATNELSF